MNLESTGSLTCFQDLRASVKLWCNESIRFPSEKEDQRGLCSVEESSSCSVGVLTGKLVVCLGIQITEGS